MLTNEEYKEHKAKQEFHRKSIRNEIIRLKKLGYSCEMIADKLGIAESSVRNMLSK